MLCNTIATCFDEHAENIFVSEKRPQLQRGMHVASARQINLTPGNVFVGRLLTLLDARTIFHSKDETLLTRPQKPCYMISVFHLNAGRKIRNKYAQSNK
jgi:hypothetical protein